MKPHLAWTLIASLALSATCLAATSDHSNFPKVVKGLLARKSSINPMAQPNGELTRPLYPAASVQAKEEGATILAISVNARGAIEKVDIQKSSGSRRLDAAAKDYAQTNWKFFPAINNGVPVPSKRIEIVTWSLPQSAN